MMPGLKKVAGSIARNFRGDIADFDAEIVEGFLQALNSLDPGKPMLYSSLRFMALRYGLEARGKEDRINETLLHLRREHLRQVPGTGDRTSGPRPGASRQGRHPD
ncbi:hypothetical protein [Amycolatopsis sp. NPDC051128]|uniref:hypothetical protein n=1 Tax=Amycolatopsis sp. NPDC051128 TaxID=3155412 RepID=UPI003432B3A9